MYTTKRYHNHEALKFVSVGDPYVKKVKPDSRTRGRQFQTASTPTHRFSGYFGRVSHPKGEKYVDRQRYLESQPRQSRKLGFGSSDANKKGEFTVTYRTYQWKEALDRERRLERALEQKNLRKTPQSQRSTSSVSSTKNESKARRFSKRPQKQKKSKFFQCRVPKLLYDIGNTKSGTTPPCTRCARDTFFCRHRAKSSSRYEPSKRESSVIGQQLRIEDSSSKPAHRPAAASSRPKTSASDAIGDNPIAALRKPQFGRRNAVREFFYSGHLHCG